MSVGMTVADLREAIKDLPGDMRVILQADSEGNGFRWAYGADADGVVTEDNGWHAEIASDTHTADEACMEEDDWAELLAQPRVLVIHPVN